MANPIGAVETKPPQAVLQSSAVWTLRSGTTNLQWDWTLGRPNPRQMGAVRRPISTAKSKHIPVQAHSFTTAGLIHLESGLEHDLLRNLDRDPDVAWIVSQPFLIELFVEDNRRPRRHVPDLLSVHSDDSFVVWDVRAAERQDEKFSLVSQLTEKACTEIGCEYRVFAGHTRSRRVNLLWLQGYRRTQPWYAAATDELKRTFAERAFTVGDVLKLDRGAGHLVSALWHLVWIGKIQCDLETQLCPGTTLEMVANTRPDER